MSTPKIEEIKNEGTVGTGERETSDVVENGENGENGESTEQNTTTPQQAQQVSLADVIVYVSEIKEELLSLLNNANVDMVSTITVTQIDQKLVELDNTITQISESATQELLEKITSILSQVTNGIESLRSGKMLSLKWNQRIELINIIGKLEGLRKIRMPSK